MIKILDENSINKIAAGEVIENPSNVVKELIENAIDANATHISIKLKTDLSLIEVSDNGDGFHKDDIKNAFLLHATSKINSFDDIEKINSFGFRGEALTSISSISTVTLITKNEEDGTKGNIYNIEYGKTGELKEYSCNKGSIIRIESLFENVPVRKKFLKDGKREMAEALDLIEKYAIMYTSVSFRVVVDDKEKLVTSGNGNIEDVIYKLYGKDVSDALIKLSGITNGAYDGIKITGYVCAPNIARNTRNEMIYFVNGRFIKSKIIQDAIESGYSGYLMEHKFPMVFIMIDIDGDKVDINVHPKKMEVRFSDEEKIYEVIRQEIQYTIAIENNLKNDFLDLKNAVNDDIYEKKDIKDDDNNFSINQNDNDGLFDDKELSDKNKIQNKYFDNHDNTNIDDNKNYYYENKLENNINEFLKYKNNNETITPLITPDIKRDFIYIGQIFKTYLLIEFNDTFYIIDQHAAHEKINYEKLMNEYKNTKVLKEILMLPIVIKLTNKEFEVVLENIDRFDKMGFEIEEMSDNTIKVSTIPSILNQNDKKDFLYELIKDFSDFKNDNNIKYESVEERIASKACRKSVKASDSLTEFEARALIKELFQLNNPYNCPHGRPTMIKYKKDDIEKLFGRIV